jgi:hypothetical protein
MFRKYLLLVVFSAFFPIFAIYAQDESSTEGVTGTKKEKLDSESLNVRPDFWFGVGGETAFYSASALAYGGSFALGYGTGSSIGLKASYYSNKEEFIIFEVDLFLRFYTSGRNAYEGHFIQLIGGASLIDNSEDISGFFAFPSSIGVLNAGLSTGWRFLFNNNFFVEPSVRFGYPYFAGLGVSAGVRF